VAEVGRVEGAAEQAEAQTGHAGKYIAK
jgi:hypothetical protein